MAEIFKPVEGYEGLYEVSNRGNVRSLAKVRFQNEKPQHYPARILKTEKTHSGYQRVMLSSFGKCKKIYVHRLVALAFVPNPLNKPQINHKNLRKFDNRAVNLEWSTLQENVDHYYRYYRSLAA